MFKRIYIYIIFMGAILMMAAQSPVRTIRYMPSPPDSADLEYYCHPKFKNAALTLVGLNTTVWAFDRYVQKAEFAKISWHSIKENLKIGFNWDNDFLGTNMFLHPYHGGLYYNSARANGFNYWQSGLFAMAGSAMWELFYENEYPSTNDIICTPIGGMAIGEVTYRASDLMVRDNSRGWKRFGHEAAVFLLCPMRGLTRIINGDAWHYRSTPGRVFGVPDVAVEVSAGVRAIGVKHGVFDRGGSIATQVKVEYGDRFELRSTNPYDYFNFKLSLNFEQSQPVLAQLNIVGRLISRELVDTRDDDVSIGLYQHYDFYDSDTISTKSAIVPYKLGVPASVGAGVLYRGVNHGNVTIDAYAHLNAVLLGGVLTDHYAIKDRNYNLASGFSVKSGANVMFGGDKLNLFLGFDYYRLYTWGYPRNLDIRSVDIRTLNAEGDDSVAYFGIAQFRADYKLAPSLFLTGTFDTYMRTTRYRDFPNVHSTSFATKLMLTWKF